MRKLLYYIGIASLLLAACKDSDELLSNATPAADDIIHVGGITADGLVARAAVTRSGDPVDETTITRTDAENIDWLRDPLFHGLNITYGLRANQSTSQVAQLKLLEGDGENGIKYSVDGTNKYAEYSFYFLDNEGNATSNPAIWHGNGAHFFQGIYLPDEIKYTGDDVTVVHGSSGTAPNLTTNQVSDATTGTLGNYTLLSRYLAMPSNHTLNATVARIKLPFRHRLARVIAYILIDPSLGNTKLRGYALTDGKDNPESTDIRFSNVGVLAGVKQTTNGNHQVYTPQWTTARKAIPHFVEERGSYNDSINSVMGEENEHFIAYYNEDSGTYIYPTDRMWTTLHGQSFDEHNETTYGGIKYTKTVYGKVPVYDLIVRPTYTTQNNVMYDEQNVDNAETKQNLYVATNQIDFELSLDNGLNYSKKFVFDLDANYQTVVYLHITRERVDYNCSGSDLWQETVGYDDYYGVNNQNGNTLSIAGSCWQRAYTNVSGNHPRDNEPDRVTDGHLYNGDTEDAYAQYVTDARWIEMLREAHEGGKHHGDYFILNHDISIPAAVFPDNFVFTGHLDGQDHTITITDGTYTPVDHSVSDSYVDYTNESGRETKYVDKYGIGKYTEFVAGDAVYCEKIETPAVEPETEPVVTYQVISDIYAYTGNTAYRRTGEEGSYTYNEIKFYKLVRSETDVYGETISAKAKPYYLFAGLNGKYGTAQETNRQADWEANVHWESYNGVWKWVPYRHKVGDTYKDGWRAEIINTNFAIGANCSVFKPDAVWGTDITGYLHNCWVNSTYSGTPKKWVGTPIEDYTPVIPQYK